MVNGVMSKMRELKKIIKDINITAIMNSEFKYVNAEMVIEAIEYITNSNKYYEVQADIIDDLQEIIEGLK